MGCRLSTCLTLISVSSCFHVQHVLCVFVLTLGGSVALTLYPCHWSICLVWIQFTVAVFYFILFFCAACLSDPPEFSPDQPTEVQVLEDDMAVIPLLVSANPEEVSCIWLHRREKLVKGDLGLCDGSINQVLVELSQQVSTQLCHSGSE